MGSHQRDEYRELIWKLSWCRQRAAELGLDSGAQLIRLALDEIEDLNASAANARSKTNTPSKQRPDTPVSSDGSAEL